MRAKAGKVFRKLVSEGVKTRFPEFEKNDPRLPGALLFSTRLGPDAWRHVLFQPDIYTDMFTIELARSRDRDYPVGRYCHDLETWRRSGDGCMRVRHLEGLRSDKLWSPFPGNRVGQLKAVADGTYPPVEDSVAGMSRAVSDALDFLAGLALPELRSVPGHDS